MYLPIVFHMILWYYNYRKFDKEKHPEISREKAFFLPTLHKRDIFSGYGIYASFSSEMPVDI